MKKIFTFALAMLAVLSMTSCQTEAENSTTTQANASQSLKNDLQVTDKDRVQDDLLPELIPDGEYGVNLDGEQVVYDKQGIKITYVGLAFNVGVCDDFKFRVENNTDGYILFDPSSIVLNGVSFSAGNSDATAAHTTEEISVGMLSEERERFISSQDDIRCFDMTFSILGDSNEYGTSGELVADGLTYVFTRGQHDHRNDGRVIKGELIFENELLALYVENSLVKKGDKLYSNYTVVNKTSAPVYFSGLTECRYQVAPVRPHYPLVEGLEARLSPNSYYTGVYCFKDEHDTLEMNEIIFILCGSVTAQMDEGTVLENGDLQKYDFEEEKVSLKNINLEK